MGPCNQLSSPKHAIKVLKSKTKVVSRSLGKVGRYRSNSENTDIFLGFGGSIRNLCNLQSYTSIIYTRLGYMHYCIYIYNYIYIFTYYTLGLGLDPPCCPNCTHPFSHLLSHGLVSTVVPRGPWHIQHIHTDSYLFLFRTQWGLQIFKMCHSMSQHVSQNVSQDVSQCRGSWANRFSVLWGFVHRVWLQPVQQIELSQVQAGCSKFVAPLNFGWAVPINPS